MPSCPRALGLSGSPRSQARRIAGSQTPGLGLRIMPCIQRSCRSDDECCLAVCCLAPIPCVRSVRRACVYACLQPFLCCSHFAATCARTGGAVSAVPCALLLHAQSPAVLLQRSLLAPSQLAHSRHGRGILHLRCRGTCRLSLARFGLPSNRSCVPSFSDAGRMLP